MLMFKALRGVGLAAALTIGLLLSMTGAALAATTPGWECVPTTAGQAVVSGGTGAAPSCSAGTTAVLAPTYVASGVGGKPTVEFSSVNVQVVNGSGSETTINGKGNLVLGYDEKPGIQTGSHNLLLGGNGNSYSSFGGILGGGFGNKISGAYSSILGGSENSASGYGTTIAGGFSNKASTDYATVTGGCSNLAGTGTPTVNSACTAAHTGYFTSVTGGTGNQAEAQNSAASGGELNTASGFASSTVAGEFNVAEDPFSMIGGGCDDVAGAGTPLTETCGSGGEGIDGGASVKYGIKDGTGGLISDVSETSESMNVTDGAGACGNLSIGVLGGQVGDTSLFTFPTTGSVPPASLRLTPLGVSTSGFSTFQVCNSSGSSVTVSDPVKVLTFR